MVYLFAHLCFILTALSTSLKFGTLNFDCSDCLHWVAGW
jgi:hypothetical protein